MGAFYSILYCTIRQSIDEKISIGLVFGNEGEILFRYSNEKLHAIQDLISNSALNAMKHGIKTISSKYKADNKPSFFKEYSRIKHESFFSYLGNYSNNLISFSTPKEIDMDFTTDLFDRLYNKFIFDSSNEKTLETPSIIERIKKDIRPKIQSHVNLEIELNNELDAFSKLDIPTKVWFVGKNERQVTGEIVDLTKRFDLVTNKLHSYFYLIKAIESNLPKHFLVADEPQSNEKAKGLWNTIRSLKNLELIPTKEIGVIQDYLMEHEVRPILTLEK